MHGIDAKNRHAQLNQVTDVFCLLYLPDAYTVHTHKAWVGSTWDRGLVQSSAATSCTHVCHLASPHGIYVLTYKSGEVIS